MEQNQEEDLVLLDLVKNRSLDCFCFHLRKVKHLRTDHPKRGWLMNQMLVSKSVELLKNLM